MILLTVFLAHDTFSELVVQETSDREGGRGGGGRVVARSAEDSGPRPTPFSACTLTLKQTSKGEKKMYRSVGVGDNSLSLIISMLTSVPWICMHVCMELLIYNVYYICRSAFCRF